MASAQSSKPIILHQGLFAMSGYILSVNGIIDSKSKNTLNKINVSFFTPALMFSKVAFSLTSEKLADLYVVPLSFVIITLTSFAVAWLLATLFRLRRAERNFCISFAMFMNSNSLPIALMTSLIITVRGQDGFQWGADDSKSKQLGRSLTYLVVFSTLGLILRWSIGVKLLSASVSKEEDQSAHTDVPDEAIPSGDESTPFLLCVDEATPEPSVESDRQSGKLNSSESPYSPRQITASALPRTSTQSSQLSFNSTHGLPHAQPANACSVPPIDQPSDYAQPHLHRSIFHSFPNLRNYSTRSLSTHRQSMATSCTSDQESIDADAETDYLIHPADQRNIRMKRYTTRFRHCIREIRRIFRSIILRPISKINQFMTPPLYAAFMSLLVVALPSLQQFLEKIIPLRSALKSAGNVSVPLTLVVLGAYFNTIDNDSSKKGDSTAHVDPEMVTGAGTSNLSRDRKVKHEYKPILVSILSRMIITPLILIPVLFVILRYFHTQSSSGNDGEGSERFHEDPCFIIVTVLLIGAPPAITLAQMTSSNPFLPGTKAFKIQAIQNSKFERLVSKTLFISYAIVTPPTTIALVVLGLLIEANR